MVAVRVLGGCPICKFYATTSISKMGWEAGRKQEQLWPFNLMPSRLDSWGQITGAENASVSGCA
jgi:hypothetical protein